MRRDQTFGPPLIGTVVDHYGIDDLHGAEVDLRPRVLLVGGVKCELDFVAGEQPRMICGIVPSTSGTGLQPGFVTEQRTELGNLALGRMRDPNDTSGFNRLLHGQMNTPITFLIIVFLLLC